MSAACLESPPVSTSIPSERVIGVRFEVCDYTQAVNWLIDAVDCSTSQPGPAGEPRGRYLCAANVADAMMAKHDPQFAAAMESSDLNVPDGAPIVWAMRSVGHNIRRRVYGPTLMEKALRNPTIAAKRHVLLAGVPDSRTGVQQKFSDVNWVGEIDFWFNKLDAAAYDDIATQLRELEADYGWVSLGGGKQILFMHELAPRLNQGVLLGVGAAFDFHAGKLAQAPSWMQERGLEWLFRLTMEPRRLWRRYLVQNPPFLYHWLRDLIRRRGGNPSAATR
jgi:N-acetylglucosaminyldiphosphoundecaprenol N-acetyl-beta-D-mannosaminyltransferase